MRFHLSTLLLLAAAARHVAAQPTCTGSVQNAPTQDDQCAYYGQSDPIQGNSLPMGYLQGCTSSNTQLQGYDVYGRGNGAVVCGKVTVPAVSGSTAVYVPPVLPASGASATYQWSYDEAAAQDYWWTSDVESATFACPSGTTAELLYLVNGGQPNAQVWLSSTPGSCDFTAGSSTCVLLNTTSAGVMPQMDSGSGLSWGSTSLTIAYPAQQSVSGAAPYYTRFIFDCFGPSSNLPAAVSTTVGTDGDSNNNNSSQSGSNTVTASSTDASLMGWLSSTTCSGTPTEVTVNAQCVGGSQYLQLGYSANVNCVSNAQSSAWQATIYPASNDCTSVQGSAKTVNGTGATCFDLSKYIPELKSSIAIDCSGKLTNHAATNAAATMDGKLATAVTAVAAAAIAYLA